MTADTATKVCDWAGGSCGQPATALVLEGLPADVFALFGRDECWRPMCDRHVEIAAGCMVAASGDFAIVTRRIDP